MADGIMPENMNMDESSVDTAGVQEAVFDDFSDDSIDPPAGEQGPGDDINISESIREARTAAEQDDSKQRALEEHNQRMFGGSRVSLTIGTPLYYKTLKKSTQRPLPESEAEYVMQITEDYPWNINTGETVFLNSGSSNFNLQFEKARVEYVVLEKGEFPIILYDKTLRKTSRYGFVLSNKYLHIHMRDFIPYKVKITRISKLVVDFGLTGRDWSTISLMQHASRKKYPFFQSIDAERVLEVADVLLKMFYHLMPAPKAEIKINGIMPENIADIFREDAADEDAKLGFFKLRLTKLKRLILMIKVMIFDDDDDISDRPAPVWNPVPEDKKESPEEAGEKQDGEGAGEGDDAADSKGKKGKKGKKDKKGKGKAADKSADSKGDDGEKGKKDKKDKGKKKKGK